MSVRILYYNIYRLKDGSAQRELTEYIKEGYTIVTTVLSPETEDHYETITH